MKSIQNKIRHERNSPYRLGTCQICGKKFQVPSWKRCDNYVCIKSLDAIRHAEKRNKILNNKEKLIDKK